MASERASGVRCGFVAPAHLLASGIARLPQAWVLALGRIATAVLWPLLGKRRRHAIEHDKRHDRDGDDNKR